LFSMDLSKVVVNERKVYSNYLYFWMMQPYVKRFMVNVSAGSTVLHLNTKSVLKLNGVFPPLPEQQKIASILTSVDEVIEKTQSQINKLQDMKKGTMNELLTKGIGHTEFKDSPVGKIPKGWEVVLLSDYIEVLTDYHSNGSYEVLKKNVTLLNSPDYAVIIRTTNFEKKDFDNFIYLSKESYEFLKKSKVLANDILMNKIANPGVSYLMPKLNMPVSLGMNLFLIRVSTQVSAQYFYYYLKKNENYVKSFASGTGTETITKQDVRNLKILRPPLPEQQKIASILSSMDTHIEEKQRKLEQTQSLKKSLMQDLLTGKVRVTVH